MPRDLADSVVIITGASAGIGRALAEVLHAHRARLVLAARRIERLEALNAALGGNHLCLRADVSQSADCERLISAAVDRFGRIDTVVCNAGYGLRRFAHETTADEFSAMFRTNVLGTSECIRAALPYLRRNEPRDGYRGQLMLVSSAVARRSIPLLGAYAATKAAQLSLAESLRVELHGDRIAVTSVHPIGTATEFGTTAEHMGGTDLDLFSQSPVTQTAEQVARKMVAAMRRPRAECWPYAPSRALMLFAGAWPWAGDLPLRRMLRRVMKR